MKKNGFIAMAVFTISTAAAVDLSAQIQIRLPNNAADEDRTAPVERLKPLPKAAKPPSKKTKKAKKPARKPLSEYKFERIDHIPAYKFDKKTNPIIKAPKPKKKAVKKPAAVKKTPAVPAQDSGTGQAAEENSQTPPQEQPEE